MSKVSDKPWLINEKYSRGREYGIASRFCLSENFSKCSSRSRIKILCLEKRFFKRYLSRVSCFDLPYDTGNHSFGQNLTQNNNDLGCISHDSYHMSQIIIHYRWKVQFNDFQIIQTVISKW